MAKQIRSFFPSIEIIEQTLESQNFKKRNGAAEHSDKIKNVLFVERETHFDSVVTD